MIGVDTNVLLRLSDEESPDQREHARRFVKANAGRLFINEIVLAEFVWTLARTFRKPRGEIAERVAILLESDEFVVARVPEVESALERYRAGRADFSDYLLAEINRSQGCSATASFDAEAVKSGDPFVAVKIVASSKEIRP
jgi:predicted nucleic-acid-binding protein